MTTAASGYIILTMRFKNEAKRWTAECVELGTATFGRSWKEAKTRIEEAVLLHLNTLEEVGERERFFRENNIQFYHEKPRRCTVNIELPCDERTLVQTHVQSIPALAYA